MRTPPSVAIIPLVLALGCSASDDETTDTASETTATTGAESDTEDTGSQSEPGPRIPIANSVLVTFVDPDGNPVPGAWIKELPADDPGPVGPGAIPNTSETEIEKIHTADSGGHILVEGMRYGEQRWILGAPGFITRTESFSVDEGTHGSMKVRMTRVGKTFMISTDKPHDVTYDNVDIRFPAGHMVNQRTGEQHNGPVEATITVIHPTTGNEDAPVVPLVGEGLDGLTSDLYSFGMVGVELTDPESGDALELNGSTSAKLAIHLDADQTEVIDNLELSAIPAWHASPKRGDVRWNEIGVFLLDKDEEGEIVATTYAVTEFSWINFDLKVDDPRCYVIRVEDGLGNPLQGKEVQIAANNSWRTVNTSADGTICYEQMPETPSATITVVPDNKVLDIMLDPGDPVSVCADNNRSFYANHTHGDCIEYTIVISDAQTCIPGSEWACESALPDELDGVGICKGSYQVCENGTEWSQCHDPVLPDVEECTSQDVQLDEDCDGDVNEDGMGCNCTPNQVKECYTGNQEDLDVPNTACKPGKQTCSNFNTWGPCVDDVTPQLEKEDCVIDVDNMNFIESCTANPCTFDPLWWDSEGENGKHGVLAVHAAKYNETPAITIVSQVDGDLKNYGNCGELSQSFEGVTVYTINTDVDIAEPTPQQCSQIMWAPGRIEGELKALETSADAQPLGVAVAGKADMDGIEPEGILPDISTSQGCNTAVTDERSFVELLSNNGVCRYRFQFPTSDYTVQDVAVGVNDSDVFAAVHVPAGVNHPPNMLNDCNFADGIGNDRSFFVRLRIENDQLKCINSAAYVGEEIAAITVNTVNDNGTVGGVTTNDATEKLWVRVFTEDLVSLQGNWQLDGPIADYSGPGNSIMPLDIALTTSNRAAIIGHYSGTVTAFTANTLDAGQNDTDVLVLVADPLQPGDRGTLLTGKGFDPDPNDNDDTDYADYGQSITWVNYHEQESPFTTHDALLISGASMSPLFTVNECFEIVNPSGGESFDGWIALIKYESTGDIAQSSCLPEQYHLGGLDNQIVSQISVSGYQSNDPKMRVALCGHHQNAIELNNETIEGMPGLGQNGQCGYAIMPVTPL